MGTLYLSAQINNNKTLNLNLFLLPKEKYLWLVMV